MRRGCSATRLALVIVLGLLIAGGVAGAREIRIGLGANLGAAPQSAAEAYGEFGLQLGRLGVESDTRVGVWPNAYAAESLDLDYRLGRLSVQAGADVGITPFMVDSLSIGTTYNLLDWQSVDRFFQRITVAAGGDLLFGPYGGFGVAPKAEVRTWMASIDCLGRIQLDNGLRISIRADWDLWTQFDLVAKVDAVIPLSQWATPQLDVGIGFDLSFDISPMEDRLLRLEPEDPTEPLQVDDFYARPSESGDTMVFGFSGKGEASEMIVRLFNASGALVWTDYTTDSSTVELDLMTLAPGPYMYLVEVTDGIETYAGRDIVYLK